MTKRIENLNRKNFRYDSCWYLRADKVVCPVKLFGSFSITFECISFSLFSGCLRRNAKISKGTRSTNSRTPDLRSLDSPWQDYKKASPRVEGYFQWNEPLKILEHSRICENITAFFMALPPLFTNFKKDSKKKKNPWRCGKNLQGKDTNNRAGIRWKHMRDGIWIMRLYRQGENWRTSQRYFFVVCFRFRYHPWLYIFVFR